MESTNRNVQQYKLFCVMIYAVVAFYNYPTAMGNVIKHLKKEKPFLVQ